MELGAVGVEQPPEGVGVAAAGCLQQAPFA
jgi:hypothetical protein